MEEKQELFGTRPVLEAIKSGKNIDKILFKQGLNGDTFHELFNLVRDNNIPYQFVKAERLNRITRKNHQGVIAFLSVVEMQSIEQLVPMLFDEGKLPLLLMLDQVSDVRNFGSIARTAECAGVHAIIIPEKGAAAMNADALKTSAGALNYIPVCRSKSLVQTAKFLQQSGVQIIAATEKGVDLYHQADCTKPTVFIMGAEGFGINPDLLKIADQLVKIPILGEIQSLNVAVASGVLLFEAVKQRTT